MPAEGVIGLFASTESLRPPAPALRPVVRGLGGKLEILVPLFGGCGNAFTLIVRLMLGPPAISPGVNGPFTVFKEGTVFVEFERTFGGGCVAPVDADDIRLAVGLNGKLLVGRLLVGDVLFDATEPILFRSFGLGNGGRAVVGGSSEGRDGRGRVAAILKQQDISLNVLSPQQILHSFRGLLLNCSEQFSTSTHSSNSA